MNVLFKSIKKNFAFLLMNLFCLLSKGIPVVSRVGLVGGANFLGGARLVQGRNFVGSTNFVGGANFVSGGNLAGFGGDGLVAPSVSSLSSRNLCIFNKDNSTVKIMPIIICVQF